MTRVIGVRERRPVPTSREAIEDGDRIMEEASRQLQRRFPQGMGRVQRMVEDFPMPLPLAIVILPRLDWWSRIKGWFRRG